MSMYFFTLYIFQDLCHSVPILGCHSVLILGCHSVPILGYPSVPKLCCPSVPILGCPYVTILYGFCESYNIGIEGFAHYW